MSSHNTSMKLLESFFYIWHASPVKDSITSSIFQTLNI